MNLLCLEPALTRAAHERKYRHVAQVLKTLRAAAGLTQEEMAARVSLTLSGYRGYERGDRDLGSEHMPRFAAALGVPVSEITRRLWPEDIALAQHRWSLDFAELQRQLADLPPEQAERVMRGFRLSVEVAHGSELARRN